MPSIDARPPSVQRTNDSAVDTPADGEAANAAIATLDGPIDVPLMTTDEFSTPANTAAAQEERNVAAQEEERLRADAAELAKRQNGHVVLKYEMYSEQFEIANGSTTATVVDEAYCLSFVMPHCRIHLSEWDPPTKVAKESQSATNSVYVLEDPAGTFHGLESGKTYYVYIEQEAEQLAQDQAKMRAIAATMDGAQPSKADKKDDGRGFESCSCIEGNPCVDEYGCKDWHNRYAIAMKNGWKGF
ncbi:hypothetical protein DYB32_004503 [Aphanomyces invadans]|uniref:Uncharacterized protein n=1 Tax=Aphanomyces invadans TaxID=157072 RepID=A0A3R6VPD3_9STRA|nr:hypothetical protein DYB32_004503 [Aphanomyces invadans]